MILCLYGKTLKETHTVQTYMIHGKW